MKKLAVLLMTLFLFASCASDVAASPEGESSGGGSTTMETREMKITIAGETATAVLENNSSADALLELLEAGPITIRMEEYGDFERVGSLGHSLPRNDRQISTIPGDIILYQGSNLTIYYDRNSWSFTRLGRLGGMGEDAIRRFLAAGRGGILEVTLSR